MGYIFILFSYFFHLTTNYHIIKKKQAPLTSKSDSREAERSSRMKVDGEEKRISYRQQPNDESGNVKTLQKKKSFFGSANLKKKVKR